LPLKVIFEFFIVRQICNACFYFIDLLECNNRFIILCPLGKRISRLLMGNPAIAEIIYFESEESALEQLQAKLESLHFCKKLVA